METSGEGRTEAGGIGRRGLLYGVLGSVALAGLFAARPIAAAMRGAGGWHRAAFGGFGHHRMNPEAAREHVQVAAKWALREVDATEEQQKQIAAILDGAVEDLHGLKERHQGAHEAFAAALQAEKVDRQALEEARTAGIALADEASRRAVRALADAAEVLTPEQRAGLLKHAHRMHH